MIVYVAEWKIVEAVVRSGFPSSPAKAAATATTSAVTVTIFPHSRG